MSPSRRVGFVGIIVGGISLLISVFAFCLPLFLVGRAFAPDLGSHRYPILSDAIISWLIGAPIAFFLGFFGAVALIVSIPIYIDAKRKEARLI